MSASKVSYKCISFSGAGFLGSYHLGSAWCFAERGQQLLQHVEAFAGASAGSLVASVLAIGKLKGKHHMDIEANKEFIINMAELATSGDGFFLPDLRPKEEVLTGLRQRMRDFLPDDAHDLLKGKCFLSVTHLEGRKNRLISEFKDKEELIEVLVGSCYIPGYFGFNPPEIAAYKCVDGGISDNLPVPPPFSDATIRISPFVGKVHIGPAFEDHPQNKFVNLGNLEYLICHQNMQRTVHALKPPGREKLVQYFEDGFNDTLAFLKKEHLLDSD